MHIAWKVFITHSQIYSRCALGMLFVMRYNLLMGLTSIVFRYDIVTFFAKTLLCA